MRLLGVRPSSRRAKKLMAVFDVGGGRTRTVHFGAAGLQDFTTYSTRGRALARDKRRQYIARHRRREDWGDPTTPGALSRFVLWEKPTVRGAVAAFRRRFRV